MSTETDVHPTDERLRRAAADLRREVAGSLDRDAALEAVRSSRPPTPARRGPWLAAAAAVLALVVGVALVLVGRDTPDEVAIDRRPSTTGTTSVPDGTAVGGSQDGTQSRRLPVTATPDRDLRPGDTVDLVGEGFTPGSRVAVVQCTMDAVELSAGAAACDLAHLGTVRVADPDGRATGSVQVRRAIRVAGAVVDCAARGVRCAVAMGQVDDYDMSGFAEVAFAAGLPPLVAPTMTVTPSEGLRHGDVVTISFSDLAVPVEHISLCAARTGDEPTTPAASAWTTSEQECWAGLVLPEGSVAPDAQGRATVEVQVWRAFSTGPEPVDCAVRRCSLQAFGGGDLDPDPVPVAFDPAGPMPPRPRLDVDPPSGLRTGDSPALTVVGLDPGTEVHVAVCGPFGASGADREAGCGSYHGVAGGVIGADGTWSGSFVVDEMTGDACGPDAGCVLLVMPDFSDPEALSTVDFLPGEQVPLVVAG